MFITDYTEEKHRALQTIHAEMSGDPELPRNFQFMITIMGRRRDQEYFPKYNFSDV